jgi:predicted DNA-binding protein
MKRTHVHLTDAQLKALTKLANATGLTMAEHIRRAIDAYLKSEK